MDKVRLVKEATELYKQNNLPQAEKLCRRVLEADANFVSALHALGIICYKAQKHKEAKEYLEKTAKLKEKSLQAKDFSLLNSLGSANLALRNFGEAKKCFEKALELSPDKAETYFNLGLAFHEEKLLEKAIVHYKKAVELNPKYLAAHNNLANIYKDTGLLTLAVNSYSQAIQANPQYAVPYNNLGNALKNKGRIQDAIAIYKKGVELNPNLHEAYSSLLLCLNYSTKHDGKSILEEHKKWASIHSNPLPKYQDHKNTKSLTRKLKIGYISPDFKSHSVSYFIEPIIESHNYHNSRTSGQFETFCYSDLAAPDETTERIKVLSKNWRDIHGLPDKDVAEMIVKDKIDILVDLVGHTSRNRLKVFARKPAPVQVTYIGYPNTTGLQEMDYRITDADADPYGMLDEFYTEKLWRMPNCFLNYRGPLEAPKVSKSPCEQNDFITFGSFMYYLPKLNKQVLNCWVSILKQAPNSKFFLKSKSLVDPEVKDSIKNYFAKNNIAEDRLILAEWTASKEDHLSLYSKIDIALDTFPYNGTTTICEALWMGVPTITLAGQLHASRVGASIMHNLNLAEFVGVSAENYVERAVSLSKEKDKIINLRKTLRKRMKQNMGDSKNFTQELEKAYREMWKSWCLG